MEYKVPLRVAIGGSVDAGKSSVAGFLKSGKLDDGNGSARQCIFNYPHEKKTGRTSSVSQRSIKINNKKIIFFDLAGHEKYFRTTLYGISSTYPHAMLVMIESNRGVLQMTKEHIISAIYLRIPIILVMTKLDIAIPSRLNQNIRKIKIMMKSAGKQVHEIREEKDIDMAIENLSENYIPLFRISAVKGNDIDPPISYLIDFLDKLNDITVQEKDSPVHERQSLVPDGEAKSPIAMPRKETLFVVDKSFRTEGYPLIGSGYIKLGNISVNDKLFIGPVYHGSEDGYIEISVRSIHDDDKNNVAYIRKNEMGCLAIKAKNNVIRHKRQLLPGMIITSVKYPFTRKFIGEVTIFNSHSTTIKIGYTTIIHCGAVRKPIRIYKILDKKENDIECLRGGDNNANVYFEFIRGKHFVQEGDRFIFREGNTRGSGHIVKLID